MWASLCRFCVGTGLYFCYCGCLCRFCVGVSVTVGVSVSVGVDGVKPETRYSAEVVRQPEHLVVFAPI